MEKCLIEALTRMTYGIYILTARASDGSPNGMIASWVSQVSYDPPLVIVSVRKDRYSRSLILQSRSFALNVVGKKGAIELSRFKKKDPAERFSGLPIEERATGAPILADAVAYLDCKVTDTIEAGDHTLFIGRVVDAGRLSEGEPMSSRDYPHHYLGAG